TPLAGRYEGPSIPPVWGRYLLAAAIAALSGPTSFTGARTRAGPLNPGALFVAIVKHCTNLVAFSGTATCDAHSRRFHRPRSVRSSHASRNAGHQQHESLFHAR